MSISAVPSSGLIPVPGRPARSSEQEHWCGVAGEVAATLARDVLERDRLGRPPYAEVDLLRSSGLLELRTPVEDGGAGQDLATTYEVLKIIARVDGSIAHVLGYHYNFLIGTLSDADPQVASTVWRESVARRWLWASTGSPQDAGLILEPEGSGWTVSGRKSFATGSRVADRLFGFVFDPGTEQRKVVVLDTSRPELTRHDDWDVLGQRLSASNGLTLDRYPLSPDDVLITYPPNGVPQPPWQTLGVLFSQLLLSYLCQGVAEGVLAQARDYTGTMSRPWFHASASTATSDPHVLNTYGELISRLQAVDALNERAAAALQWACDQGGDLTEDERGRVSEVIATSRVVANEVTLDVTTRVYDVTGARATSQQFGFDHAWRNVRTLTLHDPQAYKLAEVGDYFVNGTLPTPSPYR